jgi:transposase
MGQVLHGGATTTEAIRRAIQNSQESLRQLAKRYGINQKTVAKWKSRTSVADVPTGPKAPASTVLSIEEEAIIVAFRRHTLLPLDDCLYALQPTIPTLTRSSLHRCLQRHGISRLPDVEGNRLEKKKFKSYPIGFFHIDIAEVQTAQGKLYLYVAVDRTSKFTFVQVVRKTGRGVVGRHKLRSPFARPSGVGCTPPVRAPRSGSRKTSPVCLCPSRQCCRVAPARRHRRGGGQYPGTHGFDWAENRPRAGWRHLLYRPTRRR